MSPDRRGQLLILLAALLWSTGGMCVKLLGDLGPWAVSGGRSALACLIFLALLRGEVFPRREQRRWVMAGAGIYAFVVTSYVVANLLTTAANTIILQYTAPLWIALAGWTFIGVRPTARELVSLTIGGTGVVLCLAPSLTLSVSSGSPSRAMLGDALALGSGVGFAALTIVLRKLSRSEHGNLTVELARAPLQCMFWGNLLAALIGAPALIGAGGAAPALSWLILVYLGLFQLGSGYWCFQRGLRTTRALTASLLNLIEPVLNPLWVALAVGEIPHAGTLFGGAAVLAAVVTLLLAPRRGNRTPGR
ncbi:EamA family transporter [Candidatus Sumerlaeota bacterium]|nr:EamA family transporter [Candidatus Sumerlaeota bacterium]